MRRRLPPVASAWPLRGLLGPIGLVLTAGTIIATLWGDQITSAFGKVGGFFKNLFSSGNGDADAMTQSIANAGSMAQDTAQKLATLKQGFEAQAIAAGLSGDAADQFVAGMMSTSSEAQTLSANLAALAEVGRGANKDIAAPSQALIDKWRLTAIQLGRTGDDIESFIAERKKLYEESKTPPIAKWRGDAASLGLDRGAGR